MKKKDLKLVIVILTILVVGLSGYIIYDKITKDNEVNNPNNEVMKDDDIICDVTNLDSQDTKNCFQEFIKYIPLKYVNSALVDYKPSELTDKDISMAVWRYIYYKNDGFKSSEPKLTKEEVDDYLKKYLNLDNYEVKEMDIVDNHIFGLKKSGNNYVISVQATEFSFAKFDVTNIIYDDNNKEITIYANEYYYEMGSSDKIVNSTATIKVKHNGDNFNLISFTIND